MPVLKGEMTRRLLKCYPGGSGTDKQPVPNELSMFTFYLTTRPAKIHKASTMLNNKANHYANGDAGNFNVTALIILEMMEKLNDHFALLAEGALDIIDLTINKIQGHDKSYLELATALFTKFNKYHDGVLFMGHPAYAKKFLSVLEKFSDIASAGQPALRILALESLASFSRSPALPTHVGQKGLPAAIRGIKANIPQDTSFYNKQLETTYDDDAQRANSDKNVGSVAIDCLKKYLDTNFVDQIISIVTSLFEWVSATTQRDWQRLFVSSLPKWVPPQSRFIVTQTAVTVVYGLPREAVKEALVYTGYIGSLLTADESKIGLSVIDVLRKLIRIQQRLISSPPSAVDNSHIQELIIKLRRNIGELVEINSYPGQADDMVAEILRQYYISTDLNSSFRNGLTSSQASIVTASPIASTDSKIVEHSIGGNLHPIGVIINDFRDILEILNSKSLQSQRKLNPEMWEGTQWLLTSTNPQILVLYVKALQRFLELAQSPSPSAAEQGLIVRQLSDILSRKLAPANYIAGYYSLIFYVEFLDNLSHYSLPWIYHLLRSDQLSQEVSNSEFVDSFSNPQDEAVITESSGLFEVVCQSSVGLASFLSVFRKLGKRTSADAVFDIVSERVSRSVWLPGITFPPTMPVEDAISGILSQGSIVFGKVPDLSVSLDKLDLSNNEKETIRNPPVPVTPSSVPIDNEITARKLRASTSSIRSGTRNFTTESFASVSGSIVPGVGDLRRRETDALSVDKSLGSAKVGKKISLPPKRESVSTMDTHHLDMLSLIQSVNQKGLSQGNLTT